MLKIGNGLMWLTAVFLAGCDGGDRLAFCGEEDRDGWRLVDHARDDDGNLIACTYEAPDGSDSYTVRP